MSILTVFGTRPDAIKMAPVVLEVSRHPSQVVSQVCVTAQHREMLDQVLGLFEIVPEYDLDLVEHSRTARQLGAGRGGEKEVLPEIPRRCPR